MPKHFIFYFLVLFSGLNAYSQLSDFTLTVTVTDETCFGNGGLAFSVSGTQAGTIITYEIYKLPNTTNPIATSTGNPITGLNTGEYKVVAIQSLGGNIGTQEQTVTISDLTNPLSYSVHSSIICPNDGTITVNLISGTATTYQIVSGPNNFSTPAQTSNVFTGLEPGIYLIGVQDGGACGDFITQNHQIVYNPLPDLILSSESVVAPDIESCDEATATLFRFIVAHPNSAPLTATFTIYPPDGSTPYVQTTVITTPNSLPFNTQFGVSIPFYLELFFYDLEIIDVCGNTLSYTDIPIDYNMNINGGHDTNQCYGMYVMVGNFINSYTIEFNAHPLGFDPELFNTNHPGPFTEPLIFYGADPTGESINGNYEITITDSCGRTSTGSFNIQLPDEDPTFTFEPAPPNPPECDCNGDFLISHSYVLESAEITNGPEGYLNFLEENNLTSPYDISEFITSNFLKAPIYGCGEYTVKVIDVCGKEFTLTANMSNTTFDESFLSISQAPGCDGFGSIMISSVLDEDTIGKIETAYILDAPDEFYELFGGTITEIHDITDYGFPIQSAEGAPPTWYIGMNGLPEGAYDFNIQFGCHFIPFSYTIEAYQQTTSTEIDEMCGAFNMIFEHTANHSFDYFPLTKYWLEIYNEITQEWEIILPEITPGETIYNIHYQGNFRIMKHYTIWNNGNLIPPENNITSCVEIIDQFNFTGTPKINDVAYFPCSNGGNEVFVEATGVAPLTYQITEKDSQPFVINNGNSNLFTNLEQGVYNFRVTDDCGNSVNGIYQVNQPYDFEIIASPFCKDEEGHLFVNYFSFLDYTWWKENAPNQILSTTHQLFFESFDIEQHEGNYILNISYSGNPDSCINQTLQYEINITPPNAGNDETIIHCVSNEEQIDLFSIFTSEYDDFGVWNDISQTGQLQNNILTIGNLNPGIYEFSYILDTCTGEDQSLITINLLEAPSPPIVAATDEVCIGSDVQLSVENPNPYYTYIWTYSDGTIRTGDTILITNVTAALNPFIVTASLENNEGSNACIASTNVVLQTKTCEIPKGISPNGDGLNDSFDLSHFNVHNLKIFNRYGMTVYEAKNGYTNQWYGQSSVNDKLLPTATYFYLITFNNGNKKTGWVYLSRIE